MPYDNIPGTFGSNRNRENDQQIDNMLNEHSDRRILKRNSINFSSISTERWVDIICGSFIGLFLIVVICIWPSFSSSLFEYILFPIIYIGSKIVAFITAIGMVIGIIYAKFRRRRYW